MSVRLLLEEKNRSLTTRCNVCRKVFVPQKLSKTCPDCTKEEMDLGSKLRDYITQHQGVTVYEVCEEFKITHKQIREFIDKGYFDYVSIKNTFK